MYIDWCYAGSIAYQQLIDELATTVFRPNTYDASKRREVESSDGLRAET